MSKIRLSSAEDTFRAIVQDMILNDNAFNGYAGYIADIEFFWSTEISTACAGYGFIFFNPEYYDKLTEPQRKTVVAHEIWHLILKHLDRGIDKDPDTYNIAGDHVINNGLLEDGFEIGPDHDFGGINPCCDPQYAHMSTEQVYNAIYEKRKQNPNAPGLQPTGAPSADQIKDLIEKVLTDKGTGKDLDEVAEKDDAKLSDIKDHSMSNGDPSAGSVNRVIRDLQVEIHIQTKSYKEIFKKYLTDPLSGGKRTYLRPSRRQIHGGLKLKGKFPKRGRLNRLTHLIYALDVSGSITTEESNMFLTSAVTIKKQLNPKLMTILLWDHALRLEKTFKEDENISDIRIKAGGSTNLKPVYERVCQLNPEALIVFTDLQVTIPPKPEWDSIWFVSSKHISQSYLNKVTYGDVYLIPEVSKK